MLIRFINSIGNKTILFIITFYEVFLFGLVYLSHLFNPKYYNTKVFNALVHNIYHTSILIIPYFVIVAFFFGSIGIGFIISLATQYNVQEQIGSVIVTFVISHFSLIFTALFLSFRSNILLKTNIFDDSILPLIIGSIISTMSLSILFSIITISSAFVFTFFFMNMDLHTYKYLIYTALEVEDIIMMLIKSIVFGFTIILIPIYNIQKAKKNTLLKVFVFIFFIEIFFLLLQKVIHAI